MKRYSFVCECGMAYSIFASRQVCSKCQKVHFIGMAEAEWIDRKQKTSEVNPWIPLHEYGPKNADNWVESSARRWFLEWSKTIPSAGCSCESHWAELIQEMPPDYSSAKAFFEWSWKAHDTVSERHSKRPRISLQEAYELYWS